MSIKKLIPLRISGLLLITVMLIAAGCRQQAEVRQVDNFYETELFKEVQLRGIFEDSKTFVDLVPKMPLEEVMMRYEQEKEDADFDLEEFVEENFSDRSGAILEFETDTTRTMYEHISNMWPKLSRGPDSLIPNSSRLVLPYKYVVPGGRFKEIYYWDSYFTLEGLLVDGQEELALSMVRNFTHLIDSLGFIPNGTRDYYLTRSQPPFYALMAQAVSRKDSTMLTDYLPAMVKEYQFWMGGEEGLKGSGSASRHLVRINDSTVLNRYWDKGTTPRPEAYKEDHHLASELGSDSAKRELYTNLRAGAASGWDFSSRWFSEKGDFSSTSTARIAAVDLNCLLYYMERQIAKAYRIQGNAEEADRFEGLASWREEQIRNIFWSEELQFFTDYNIDEAALTDELTLAGAFPLFFEIATEQQAKAVRDRLMEDFLKAGGLLTTLDDSGQQWDAPNGWAPLQWISVHGLLNYGYDQEAREIMERWLATNERVYKNTGKMMEKYNVVDVSLISGGGEYKTQDGFGWTNGVAVGFRKMLDEME